MAGTSEPRVVEPRYLVAGVVLLVGYAIAALLFAASIYLPVAIFHDGLSVIPGDQGDLITLAVIAGLFYAISLIGAPGRLKV